MPKKRSWSDSQLIVAVANAKSVRSVIKKLGLIPAGGNYSQVNAAIVRLSLNTNHFTGSGWSKGIRYHNKRLPKLDSLLIDGSSIQSYKLKNRLYESGLKSQQCELCGWAEMSPDGRVPLELDHINGKHTDNRIENLRILCPNCHSLQSTHRGRNKKSVYARML